MSLHYLVMYDEGEEELSWWIEHHETNCPTCNGKGVLGGCGRDDCDHMHTYMFCPDCNPQPDPQPKVEGGEG